MQSLARTAVIVLPEDEIHVWLASTDAIYDAALLELYRTFLTPEERAKELRFYAQRDRRSYLVTRALVRTTLSQYLQASPEQWQFETGEFGKPRIVGPHPDSASCEINISHTDGITTLALAARRPLGVDVENRKRRAVSAGIADHYFAPAEVRALRAMPEERQPEAFLDWWTLKEAYTKAVGKGLQVPLDAFAFDLDERGGIRMHFDPSLNDDPGNWHCWRFDLPPSHTFALCARRLSGREPQLVVRQVVPLREWQEVGPIRIRYRSGGA